MNQYQTPPPFYPVPPKKNGAAIASLICGIIAFLINPLYLVSVAGIVTGIVGLCSQGSKGKAVVGIILSFIALAIQIVLDIILSVFTFGLSFFF